MFIFSFKVSNNNKNISKINLKNSQAHGYYKMLSQVQTKSSNKQV